MENLKEETIREVGDKEVDWVGSSDGQYVISWEKFLEISDINYDDGFGGQEIYSDLVIVFKDGTWLSRWEYDGSEGWSFNKIPVKKKDSQEFSEINIGLWNQLSNK